MKIKLLILLILNAFSASALAQVSISMVHLLADGEKFNGAAVEVFGYMASVGGAALYLTRDHVGDTPSRVRLQVTDEMTENFVACKDRYVRVVGELVIDEGALYLENLRSIFDPDRVMFCHRE